MILRRLSQARCPVLVPRSLPPTFRALSSSPSSLALSRKDSNRGSRHTRVTQQQPREHPLKELEVIPPQPSPAVESSPTPPPAPTPPWPTTSSPAGTTFPWTAYNEGPAAPNGRSAVQKAGPVAVEATEEDRPPVTSLPVEVPHDEEGVLDNAKGEWSEKARELFSVAAIIVARQLEMMNLFIGYEEANKYQLLSPTGELLGYLMEEDLGLRAALTRQMLRTHRAFRATVLDKEGNVLLVIRRPFSWINSRIYISTAGESPADEGKIIGEAQQDWHLYRRRYNQFVKRDGEFVQFGTTDSGFLAWDFFVRDASGQTLGSINRNFAGLGRELFTDTGQYVLRFEGVVDELLNPAIASPPPPDALPSPSTSPSPSPTTTLTSSSPQPSEPISSVPATIPLPSITLDQRAVMLASAISIDFDYFTRSRGGMGSGMGMWMPMPMGGIGGSEVGSEAAGGAAGAMGEEPLPSAGSTAEEGEEGGVYEGGRGEESYGSGGWSEAPMGEDPEVMVDPWATTGGQEEGGTWSWGDLFQDE